MKRSPEPCNVFQTKAKRGVHKAGEVNVQEGCAAVLKLPDEGKTTLCDKEL